MTTTETTTTVLPLERIRPSAENYRIGQVDIADLAKSIKRFGIIHPIVVRAADDNGTHEIIAGERRYRAALAAGLTSVRVEIRPDVDAAAAAEIRAVENFDRADLSPIEEGRALAVLNSAHGYSRKRLAEQLRRSAQWVRTRLRLLELPDDLQMSVHSGDLAAEHALAVYPLLDHPTELAAVIENNAPRNWDWATEQAVAALARQQELAEAVAKVKADGYQVADDVDQLPEGTMRLSSLPEVDANTAAKAGVLAFLIARHSLVPMVTDPIAVGYTTPQPKTNPAGNRLGDPTYDKEAARQQREARTLRREFIAELVRKRPTKAVLEAHLYPGILQAANTNQCRIAAQALGLNAHADDHGKDWRSPLTDFAGESPTHQLRAVYAITVARWEDSANYGIAAPYVDLLTEFGYQPPNEYERGRVERAHRLLTGLTVGSVVVSATDPTRRTNAAVRCGAEWPR